MQKITPFLWFDNNAEEALNFYTSIFKNSKIVNARRWGKGAPGPEGSLMTATFQLEGQEFMALNGGPMFKFTEAISLFISCQDQSEIDMFWEKLSAGGQKSRCGWLKDKYGLWWQVVPAQLGELLSGDAQKSKRVMDALMKMDKLDVNELKAAGEKQ